MLVAVIVVVASLIAMAQANFCGDLDSVMGDYKVQLFIDDVEGIKCDRREQADIATTLEDGLDYYMEEILDGMGIASNKICKHPIEGKRARRFLQSERVPKRYSEFVYNGAGRCRLCIPESKDDRRAQRNLFSRTKMMKPIAEKNNVQHRKLSQSKKIREKKAKKLFAKVDEEYQEFLDRVQKEAEDEAAGGKIDIEEIKEEFEDFLESMENYLGHQLSSVLLDTYEFLDGHCFYDEDPDVEVTLRYSRSKRGICAN